MSSDFGIILHDINSKPANAGNLLAIALPNQIFNSQSAEKSICRSLARDFSGAENIDPSSVASVLDFSFYLSIGNIDEAFKVNNI